MQIKFDVFWTKNLGTLYKDNSVDTYGKEAKVDLDLKEVHNIHINFKVNDKSFTDIAHIVDVEGGLIRIPFKTDVIKLGTHELELVATMKNGDVLPSQTYKYTVDKSLENPNSVEADTNYPVLIELLNLAGNKLIDMDESIQKVNTSIENMTNEISNYKEATTNALNSDISSYKETTTKELEDNFNNYSNNTTSNITKVLDNKIVEVDNVVSIKSNELDVKFTTKSNEITKTLNDEINKVEKTLNSEINKVNTTLTNKVNEVDRVLDTTVTTINAELNKKSKEIDNRVNAKINDINTSLNNKINEVNEVIEEVELSEQARKEEHTELVNELSSYSSDMNNVKDRVDVLEAKVTDNEVIVDLKNKVNNHEERITTSEKTIRHQGILLNALNDLDDTISIEEEGTIISLPQSNDGKVIIDELQGNTLVNYCTNGSEELTLNNEIDIEGTNVILTDTVDNGKVDVVCEGNTLVNVIGKFVKDSGSAIITDEYIQLSKGVGNGVRSNGIVWKPSTVYTMVYTILETNLTSGNGLTLSNESKIITTHYIHGETVGTHKAIFTTKSDSSITTEGLVILISNLQGSDKYIKLKDIYVLEGDWTNKEIPPYFEGMKSVGECEDNKIEITSQAGNLYNADEHLYKCSIGVNGFSWGHFFGGNRRSIKVPCKPNTTYTLSKIGGDRLTICSHNEDFDGNTQATMKYCYYNSSKDGHIKSYTFTTHSDSKVICAYVSLDNLATNIRLEELPNKKEIQLSEPLRGLPNGVCDKFVKQGGKWYVERNCGEVRITKDMKITLHNTNSILTNFCVYLGSKYNPQRGSISNILLEDNTMIANGARLEGYYIDANNDQDDIYIRKLNSNCNNLDSFYNYLDNTDLRFVVRLATPTYEEITDPQIITYLDTTHISTNSTIPCNMKITNSGYNAIIKPSTLYTVAFDTNTSGEVNIDLGGAKTSTTNGVATITTPSTLTDDSLTLYGKGIKASNIRLLEGDKTNYIPGFFEGMKSCFEDKEQDNGSYEVEIISSNLDNSKSNSIQLQLNEPLRAVGGVKDRFVLKDGKLMMERNCGIREYQEGDLELDNALTDKTNTTYVLNEPMYEEVSFETQKLILECFENGTLFIDTLIPPTVSITYSANKPVVAKLNQVDNATNVNTEDIAMTQMAVDFLLMSSLGEEMINFKIKGGTNMSAYFASRIIKGALKYEDVISKYPNYKEDIDLILIVEGYSDLIVEL